MALAERKRRDQSSQCAVAAQRVVELACGALARGYDASTWFRKTAAWDRLHNFTG